VQEPLLSQVQTLQLPLSMLQLELFKSPEPEQPCWLQPSAATANTVPPLLKQPSLLAPDLPDESP
jgi:hypothetical protein